MEVKNKIQTPNRKPRAFWSSILVPVIFALWYFVSIVNIDSVILFWYSSILAVLAVVIVRRYKGYTSPNIPRYISFLIFIILLFCALRVPNIIAEKYLKNLLSSLDYYPGSCDESVSGLKYLDDGDGLDARPAAWLYRTDVVPWIATENYNEKLLDLNTETREALIKSEYDSSTYLVEYGLGCYDSSFGQYLNKNIVVNLGTDYSVDRWDTIVLQDHGATCDIKREERSWYSSFEEIYPEEDLWGDYVQPTIPSPINTQVPSIDNVSDIEDVEVSELTTESEGDTIDQEELEQEPESKKSFWSKVARFFKRLFGKD